MSKVIEIDIFDPKSVQAAIDECNNWLKWLDRKAEEFVLELALEGLPVAQSYFSNAVYDGTNDVTCQLNQIDDKTTAIVAVGDAVLFIEFGTGVRYPDTHPESGKLGMIRGEYGLGRGKSRTGWTYWGDPGTNGISLPDGYVKTYGNPANSCLYMTRRDLQNKVSEIAKKVFVYE